MSDRKQLIRDRIEGARQELLTAIQTLDDGDWDRPTSNPEWTARDLLVHLSIAEPGLRARMGRILEGTSQLPPDWDLNRYNNRQVEKRRGAPIGELVQGLTQSRQDVVRFLDGLTEEQLDTRGWHASGREMTVLQVFEILADHERSHAKDILTAKKG